MEIIKSENWKVFEFAREGKSYTVKSTSKEEARKFLKDEYDIDIQNSFEIPESEWDNKIIEMHEDNDTEKEAFFISLRDAFSDDQTELLCTNDSGIID